MELSILVAQILAVIYISAGFAVLLKKLDFIQIVEELENSPALSFVSGAFGVIIGMILVSKHNLWVSNWQLIITLVSWGMLLGGITMIIFPKSYLSLGKIYTNRWITGIFMLSFGLILGYFGFIT